MESKHFSHEHPLVFHQVHQGSQTHCSGCKSPATGNVYACWQCSYFLHEQCFRATRSLKHPSHPLHPLSLVPCPTYPSSSFFCNSCSLAGDGFSYSCSACEFDIHVHCALTPNPNYISNTNPHLIPSHNYNINPHPQNSVYPPPNPIQAYPPQQNTTLQNQTQNYATPTPYPPPSQEHYPPPTVYPQPIQPPQPNQPPTPIAYPQPNQPPQPTAFPQPNQPPPPTGYPQQNPTQQNYVPPAANQPPQPAAYPQPNQPPPPTSYPQPNPPTGYPQQNPTQQNCAPPAANQPNPPTPTYSTVVTATTSTGANPPQPQSSNSQAMIKHFSHPHVMKQMEIEEKKAKVCSACECELSGAAYCCTEGYCTFNLHKSCFDSPHEVRHKSHLEHPLTLLTAPSYNDGFTCNACLKDGKAFVYNCATCSYDLHIDCVQWPDAVHRPDHKHDLALYYSSPAAAQSGEEATFMCDVCMNPVHEMAWVYYCRECDFGTHLECVASGMQQQQSAAKTEDELLGEVELKFAVLQLLLQAKAQDAILSNI